MMPAIIVRGADDYYSALPVMAVILGGKHRGEPKPVTVAPDWPGRHRKDG